MQQVLAQPGILEKLLLPKETISSLCSPSRQQALDMIQKIRSCFTGLYDFSPETTQGKIIYDKLVSSNGHGYVLKPQREGGGNNIYNEDIPDYIKRLTAEDRKGYIVMDLIQPPRLKNTLVRSGSLIEAEIVNELGVYGVFLR